MLTSEEAGTRNSTTETPPLKPGWTIRNGVLYAPPSPRNGHALPAGTGRPKGRLNNVTLEARDFARCILDSEEYRASLMRRIQADTLPPQIESLLYHYRYGKPKDTLEVNVTSGQGLDELGAEQLAQEAQNAAAKLVDLMKWKRAETKHQESEAA